MFCKALAFPYDARVIIGKMIPKELQFIVKITSIGFTDIGISHIDDAFLERNKKVVAAHPIIKDFLGKTILTAGTLPDEVALVSVKRNKKGYIEARKIKTIEASPLEINPTCKHFEICGGCKWQHISYEQQLKFKEDHVRDAFSRIGGFEESFIKEVQKPIVECGAQLQYRNKMEFSFGWDAEMERSFGFHSPGRRYDIFNLSECHLVDPKIVVIAKQINQFMLTHKIPPFKFKENAGVLRSLIIRHAHHTDEILINLLTSGEEIPDSIQNELIETLKEEPIKSFYITQIKSQKGRRTTHHETLLFGEPTITEHLNVLGHTYQFEISPSSFFQPNTLQAQILYETAFQNLNLNHEDIVFDLFCGTGTIGIIAAPHVKEVIGIELNEAAVENANTNAIDNEIANITFVAGDVGKILEQMDEEGTLEEYQNQKIIIDPPRSGMTSKMIDYLLKLLPSHIAYVSCNPSTQARDIAVLSENGYELISLTPVDMFPQTYHIENVAYLKKSE